MENNGGTWGKVRKAFAILRKQGVEARMNFMCCSSCACANMDDKRPKKVYFHNQDTDNYIKRGGSLAIRYWVEQGKDSDEVQESKCLEHAKNIKAILESVGCKVMWEGSTSKILEVIE